MNAEHRTAAIDPGETKSAIVVMQGQRIIEHCKLDNAEILHQLTHNRSFVGDHLYIEKIASYGMRVGQEIFDTCIWIGEFKNAALSMLPADKISLVYRMAVKMHLCGRSNAKDADIRTRIIDIYGGKEKGIGNKKNPGPLYGVKADVWAAIALGLTAQKLPSAATSGWPTCCNRDMSFLPDVQQYHCPVCQSLLIKK